MNQDIARKERITGTWYTIISFASWGFLPLYWYFLKKVPAIEILGHRIFWSLIFSLLLLAVYGRLGSFKAAILNRKTVQYVFITSMLISINWFLYIWAINSGHVVETSLGYYITPLFNVLMGMIILKERLNFWQYVSLFLAAAGVAFATNEYGQIPWIALTLASTFSLYGLVKKLTHLDSITALSLETFFVTPIALVYLTSRQINGTASLGLDFRTTVLLVLCGVVTAMPLIWFAEGAKRVPLSTVGFIQYVSPSLQLCLGILVFKEPFTKTIAICFSLIWLALIVFTLSNTALLRRLQSGIFKKAESCETQ